MLRRKYSYIKDIETRKKPKSKKKIRTKIYNLAKASKS